MLAATGARSVLGVERIQSVWSGWGDVLRLRLEGPVPSVVVKHVHGAAGPHTSIGDRRKVRSYEVEAAFYQHDDASLRELCRYPLAYHAHPDLFVLEDLDHAGYSGRFAYGTLPDDALAACVTWLAHFHRHHLGRPPDGLWPVGTYWHLGTRPDEHLAMADGALKHAATALDHRLRSATHQTWVHGDAKPANFCFGPAGVAAVDFQYVGGGPGVVDLVYLLGGAVGGSELARTAPGWVDHYFRVLDDTAVEEEWRTLLPFAWADFERFLAGWSPGHWKRSGYAHTQTLLALARL